MSRDHALSDYALWLVLRDDQQTSLQREITRLSQFKEPTPTFLPHITLYHPLDLSTPVEEILASLKSAIRMSGLAAALSLDLQAAQAGQTFYQSVLAPVTLSSQLLALRSACQTVFGSQQTKRYFPHLSLKYGDLDDSVRRQTAATVTIPETMVCKGVGIVRCVGQAEQWEVVAIEEFGSDP